MARSNSTSQRLPADPEFLLEYIDGIPSEDSDDEFDGYVDNPTILNVGNETSSFQNYSNSTSPVPNNTVLEEQAPPVSNDDYPSFQMFSPLKVPTTEPTPIAQTHSVITPITTINIQELFMGLIKPRHRRDQTPPTSRPGRYNT